jgi:hypothetical protein
MAPLSVERACPINIAKTLTWINIAGYYGVEIMMLGELPKNNSMSLLHNNASMRKLPEP